VFETGEAGQLDSHYQMAEINSFFLVAAWRSSEVLVASVPDGTYHHDRPALEETLRQS